MRTVARYSLIAEVPEIRDHLQDYLNLLDRAQAWINSKGDVLSDSAGGQLLRFRDGREGTIRITEIDLGAGGSRESSLTEPTDENTLFETRLAIGLSDRAIAVYCELRVGGRTDPIGPIRFDANCPRIVRDFLSYDLPWMYGDQVVAKTSIPLRGIEGGEYFAQLLRDAKRRLPLVAISESQGFLLHPGIGEAAASDLAGLATIAVLDDGAAWRLSQVLGVEWSCFSGAIRLYWPGVSDKSEPRDHPLWTARRLLDISADTETAARVIRQTLRRRVMAISGFTVREPSLLAEIRAAERATTVQKERAQLREAEDYLKLAESYSDELIGLKAELERRQQEIDQLRSQVANLEVAFRWRDSGPAEDVEPESSMPPVTVTEAVQRAREKYVDALEFGPDVEEYIADVAPDAGPPDKIGLYLDALAEFSRAKREGPLGTSHAEWFKQRNVAMSGEHPAIENSTTERARRTWSDGVSSRYFEWHLKPAEGAHPDRCVRIYFDWDESRNKVVVPYIGRHP